MNFKEIKNTLNEIMNNNYEDCVKALISVEKGVNNQEALNNLYEQFMENNEMNLLYEEFDYMIDELANNGAIKESDKEVELSEYVGNVVSDVKVEEVDGGNRKYILCTDNENNICEEVTYQRLKNIQEELPHNLKHFKTKFISKYAVMKMNWKML